MTDRLVKAVSGLAALVGCLLLGWVLLEVARRGMAAMDWSFFTELPAPPGEEGGGLGNAILGTLIMTGLATLVGVPLGMMAGMYLAEFGRGGRPARAVRFAANLLMGVPSIIIGIFVYTLLVVPMGHFSGYAGAAALAIIMLPIVARTTEDMMNLVPNTLREAGLALGAPKWRVTFQVVLRSARVGVLTGVILAVARVSGETAPLLFTALNSSYWPESINGPTANLTVQIFNFAMSPYDNWQELAWAAALLITAGVLLATILCRLILGKPIAA